MAAAGTKNQTVQTIRKLFESVCSKLGNLVFCVELCLRRRLSSLWYRESARTQQPAGVQTALLPHATLPLLPTGTRRDSAPELSTEMRGLFAHLVARLWQCLLYSEQLFALAEQNNYSVKLKNLLSAVTDALVFLESHGFGLLLFHAFKVLIFPHSSICFLPQSI